MVPIAFSAFVGFRFTRPSSWENGAAALLWRARWRRFRAAAVCVATLLCGLAEANAESWERLPDGRVIIQVKDLRLALPSEGRDVDFITFSDISHGKQMRLKNVIAAPDVARRMFADAKSIDVAIVNQIDEGLWLGKFSRSELKSVRIVVVIGPGVGRHCDAWQREFDKLKASLTPNDPRVGSDGLAEFNVTPSRAYVRGRGDLFPGVSCGSVGTCDMPKCLGSNVGVKSNFSEKAHGRASWQALNLKLHDVLKFVLIDVVK